MTTGDASAPSKKWLPLQMKGLRLGHFRDVIEEKLDREREQLPLWLPVGLGLGIASWFLLPDTDAWIALSLACVVAIFSVLLLAGGTRAGRAVAIFSLAVMLGCANMWWRAERVAAPRLTHEQMAQFDARVEAVTRLPARKSMRLVVLPLGSHQLPPRLRVNVDYKNMPEGVAPGAKVRLRAWLMPPAPAPVPGAYDFSRAAWFQAIGGTGKALGRVILLEASKDESWQARLAAWRQALAFHIGSRLAGGAGGVATALATGDQGGIPEEDAEAMRRSGLAHLLSVSGLHLTAVVGAVMFLTLKLLALSPSLALRFRLVLIAAAAGAAAGVFYTLFTGAEVPTIRSCIAAILLLIGIALGREALTLRLVAVGALFILMLWPESLVGASFQLSFAAISAIVILHDHPRVRGLLARRDEGIVQKSGRALVGLLLTGIAVEIALAPIALYHFHRTGLYGAMANIVAIPLTTFVIMPLEALALLLDLAGLGWPLWWLTARALELLLALAHGTATAPGAVAMLPTMPDAAFALMILGGFWLGLWRTRWRRWGALAFTIGAIWAISTPAPDLLVTGDGRHMAVRAADGQLAILRGRAGDYVRDMFSESSGLDTEPMELDMLSGARCSADFCFVRIDSDGARWRVLATRSRHLVDYGLLARACSRADIVVSDRRLPTSCRPRWLKADRAMLSRSGGLAITLGQRPQVATVSERVGRHPWAVEPWQPRSRGRSRSINRP